MTQPLVSIPWPVFKPAPADEDWEVMAGAARKDYRTHTNDLAGLMACVQRADIHQKGSDGTPLLSALLMGWGGLRYSPYGSYPTDTPYTLAQFPLRGENPWNGQGKALSWEVPAAALIARGANPFEEGPDGVRPWDIAVQYGAAAVVDQMLRHPLCPKLNASETTRVTDWKALTLRYGESLVKKKGDGRPHPNLPSPFEPDPLHHAVCVSNKAIVGVLLKHGYPAEVRNQQGQTPLFRVNIEVCNQDHYPEMIIAQLIDAGAHPLPEDNNGLTPLEVWSLHSTSGALRKAWLNKTLPLLKEDARLASRAIAAALFANATDILPKLPGKPRGAAWGLPGSGAPSGYSWLEWATLGAIARKGMSSYFNEKSSENHAKGAKTAEILFKAIETPTEQEKGLLRVANELSRNIIMPEAVTRDDFLNAISLLDRHRLSINQPVSLLFEQDPLFTLRTVRMLKGHHPKLKWLDERIGWMILRKKEDTSTRDRWLDGMALTGEDLVHGLKACFHVLALSPTWQAKKDNTIRGECVEVMLARATQENIRPEDVGEEVLSILKELPLPAKEHSGLQYALSAIRAWLIDCTLEKGIVSPIPVRARM